MTANERDGYVIAGGGTGGHVFPALALAGEIRRRRPDASIVFVGTKAGIENDLVPRAGFPLEHIRARGLVGKSAKALAQGALALPLGVADSWRLLSRHRPRAVVGVGGYASGPVLATAWARKTPTVIHESNAVPGVTNRLLSKVATAVAVGTEAALASLPKATVVGNPVRAELFAIPAIGTGPRRFRVLVVGGSQGAAILNRLVPPALVSLGLPLDIVHQAGRNRTESRALAEKTYGDAGWKDAVKEFLHDMVHELSAADLVIARSGAMTVAEIAAAGRPSLLVPFALATHGHQEANARSLERVDAALVVTEVEASSERIATLVRDLFANPARLSAMGEAARTLARPDAAARFCDLVFSVERREAA